MKRIIDEILKSLRANMRAVWVFAAVMTAHAFGLLTDVGAVLVMLGTGYMNVLASQRAVGTSFATYTTAKTVINQTELVQLPPNYLYVGKRLRVTIRGGMSTLVTTPGTVVFQIMMGSIVAWTSGNIQLNATAHTLLPFNLVVDLRVDSIGTGTNAKFLGMGVLQGVMFTLTAGQTDAANTAGAFAVPATAPAVGTGFDSTIANILDAWVGFSISSGSNAVQVYDYIVEEMN